MKGAVGDSDSGSQNDRTIVPSSRGASSSDVLPSTSLPSVSSDDATSSGASPFLASHRDDETASPAAGRDLVAQGERSDSNASKEGTRGAQGTPVGTGEADIEPTASLSPGDPRLPLADPSPTATFHSPLPGNAEKSELIGEDDQTIVSQQPVAAPEEFYSSIPLAELASLLEGKQLDHFSVQQMIGGGGMGAVFRGLDERLNRIVAIKVIPGSKRDAETLRRFRQEAQAAARLDHPNIARVYYVGEAERWSYIVFEFIDGVNIRDLVSLHGPLSIDDAVYFTRQVAEALAHAHDREVVHRDIKPSNILVTATGMVKVVDMGLARNTGLEQSTGDATASGVTLGTFDYISPEQARNPRDADVRSDLYSLGCSLFFMLTGKPPFSEGTVLQKLLKHGSVPPPDPRGWREDISDQLYAILMKLMAKQPNERYQTPIELINDLLLLAEIEELPRSQMQGTVMLTPSIAQRSLMEVHLPWMVAFAFLLGSTLWLQTVLPISQRIELEDIGDLAAFPTAVADSQPLKSTQVGSPVATMPVQGSDVDDGETNATQANDSQVFVVSAYRPAGTPVDAWAPDLQTAVTKLHGTAGAIIEIKGAVEVAEPITFDNMQVTIRGDLETTPRILPTAAMLRSLGNGEGIFHVKGSRVTLDQLGLRCDTTKVPTDNRVAVFRITGRSSFSLFRSTVTMEGVSENAFAVAPDLYEPAFAISGRRLFDLREKCTMVYVDETKEQVPSEALGDEQGGDSAVVPYRAGEYRDVDISIQSSMVRGYGSVVELRADLTNSNQFAMSVEGSLIAVSGFMLEAGHTANLLDAGIERNTRVYCKSSTISTARGFAQFYYASLDEPLLNLNRTANQCAFTSSKGAPHLSIVGLGPDNLLANLKRFLLQGVDNAYDANVDVLCKCYDRDEAEMFSFGFNTATRERWFEEKSNERQVRWLSVPDPAADLSEVTQADFAIAKEKFLPGFEGEEAAPPF